MRQALQDKRDKLFNDNCSAVEYIVVFIHCFVVFDVLTAKRYSFITREKLIY